jgi:triphosphoribosyl-dephospho-CoA synthetase
MSALSTADLIEQNAKAQNQATRLGSLAVRALIEEAELTPKPALVDQRGPGGAYRPFADADEMLSSLSSAQF